MALLMKSRCSHLWHIVYVIVELLYAECIDSEEGSKEQHNARAESESVQPRSHSERQRISDVDMFSTDIAGQQHHHVSGDSAVNYVDSSNDIEIVPPSPLPLSKSSCIQSSSVLKGSSTALDPAACSQQQKVDSYPDVEMLNDVEPDGSSSSASTELLQFEQSSRRDAVDSSHQCLPAGDKRDHLITDKKQKLSASSHRLTALLKGVHLPECRGIPTTSQSQSDDAEQLNTELSSIANDNDHIVCDLETQSTQDLIFHSCDTVDLDSSLVNI